MKSTWPLVVAGVLLVVWLSAFWWLPAPGAGGLGAGWGGGMMGGGAMSGGMMGGWGQPVTPAAPDGAAAPATAIPADATVVNLQQMRFVPGTLQVKAGTTVTFVNRDAYPHRVVQSTVNDLGRRTPSFVSPVLNGGQAWSYTFTTPGTYPILCDVAGHHLAGMVGTIEVVN